MNPIKSIPNLLTILNLCCGIIGIQPALSGDLIEASYLILIAVAFDFGDGFAARLLRAQSPIGKQLDSLADLLSFGVLPGFIYHTIFQKYMIAPEAISLNALTLELSILIVPILSALRLAKFNVDENQSEEFIGLSTTAHAIFVSALVLCQEKFQWVSNIYDNPYPWLITMVIGSLLLVSPIRLIALKFTSFYLKDNWIRYFLIGSGLIFIFLFKEAGVLYYCRLYIDFRSI